MLGRESCLDYQRAWVKNHRRDTRYAIRAAKHAAAAAGHAHENVLPLPVNLLDGEGGVQSRAVLTGLLRPVAIHLIGVMFALVLTGSPRALI